MVHWRPQYDAGTYIDLLGRNEKTRKTYVAKVPGKGIQQAVLHYRLLDNRQGFSLVEIRLESGDAVLDFWADEEAKGAFEMAVIGLAQVAKAEPERVSVRICED